MLLSIGRWCFRLFLRLIHLRITILLVALFPSLPLLGLCVNLLGKDGLDDLYYPRERLNTGLLSRFLHHGVEDLIPLTLRRLHLLLPLLRLFLLPVDGLL